MPEDRNRANTSYFIAKDWNHSRKRSGVLVCTIPTGKKPSWGGGGLRGQRMRSARGR